MSTPEAVRQQRVVLRRQAAGLCPNCGKRRPQNKRRLCRICLLYKNQWQRKRRMKERENAQ